MMTKVYQILKMRSGKIGMQPGALVHVGERKTDKTQITVWDYDEQNCRDYELEQISDCVQLRESKTVTWINLNGLHDISVLEEFGRIFDLHPLMLEDILDTRQRPKIEDYGNVLYVVLKMFYLVEGSDDECYAEQFSLALGKNFVLTFQERPGDVFNPLRDRLRHSKGRVRKMGADYLFYSMLDALIDSYFVIFEKLGESIESIEDALMNNADEEMLRDIYRMKRELLLMRKHVRPVCDLARNLRHEEYAQISDEIHYFMRDLHDHATEASELIDTLREALTGVQEIYLNMMSNKMNSVMKLLTIIATIFIPLTFIAGVYGMNFNNMPELHAKYGYPMVMGLMTVIFVGMVLFFKRKGWL